MADHAEHASPRMRSLLDDIAWEAEECASWTGKDKLDARVLEAIRQVARHEFVPDYEASRAYANGPLPIGYGQTISQPFIVALMSDLLATAPDHVVLEVGCGSGYQSAVLSRLVKQV